MPSPIRKAFLRPHISPSLPPVSISAAIVRVKKVIAACMEATVVFKSFTTVEIDTFITVASSTIMNCARANSIIADHFFIL